MYMFAGMQTANNLNHHAYPHSLTRDLIFVLVDTFIIYLVIVKASSEGPDQAVLMCRLNWTLLLTYASKSLT